MKARNRGAHSLCLNLCFTVFLVTLTTCPLLAIDDTIPAGKWEYNLFIALDSSSEFFDTFGEPSTQFDETTIDEYEDQWSELTMTYGLYHDISLVFSTRFNNKDLTTDGPSFSSSGASDVYMGMRQRLSPRTSAHVLLSEWAVVIPAEYDEDESLPLGSGGVDWIGIMSYSQNFFPTRGGFEMDFGYRFRNEQPDDEYFFNTKLQLGLGKRSRVIFGYHMHESTSNSLNEYDPLSYPRERGSQRWTVALRYEISPRWHMTAVFGDQFAGRNDFAHNTLGLQIHWRP